MEWLTGRSEDWAPNNMPKQNGIFKQVCAIGSELASNGFPLLPVPSNRDVCVYSSCAQPSSPSWPDTANQMLDAGNGTVLIGRSPSTSYHSPIQTHKHTQKLLKSKQICFQNTRARAENTNNKHTKGQATWCHWHLHKKFMVIFLAPPPPPSTLSKQPNTKTIQLACSQTS